jgi:hypothetical protein
MTIFLYAIVEIWRQCHAVFSRAKTCAKVIHIFSLTVSASSPLVVFGELNDNAIKDLTKFAKC